MERDGRGGAGGAAVGLLAVLPRACLSGFEECSRWDRLTELRSGEWEVKEGWDTLRGRSKRKRAVEKRDCLWLLRLVGVKCGVR